MNQHFRTLFMSIFFYEIKSSEIKNYIILIDIDGTLTNHSNYEIEQRAVNKIMDLKESNSLYLCSNNKNNQRNLRIANRLNIPLITCPYKKPNKNIINSIINTSAHPLLIIGDTYLTDIRLANRLSCRSIRIKRVISRYDSIFLKAFYLLDDIVYFLAK